MIATYFLHAELLILWKSRKSFDVNFNRGNFPPLWWTLWNEESFQLPMPSVCFSVDKFDTRRILEFHDESERDWLRPASCRKSLQEKGLFGEGLFETYKMIV